MRIRLSLAAWTVLIIAAVVPWFNYTDHSHWNVIQWTPFVTPPQRIRDWVVNLLLYVPFGYLIARQRQDGHLWRAILCSGLLSFATETTQMWSHTRFPSTTDLACNVCGAIVGVRLALARAHKGVA